MAPRFTAASLTPVNWGNQTERYDGWLWPVCAAVLLVVFLVATWPLASGTVYPIWDAANFYAPAFTLVADFARHAELLSWNPWTNGGSPDFADPQYGAFSPIHVLFGLLFGPVLAGFEWYWLLTWLAGALGMLVMARSLGAPPWGAIVVSLGFAFSGFFTGHAQHTTFLHAYAALPWAIWRLDAALRRRSVVAASEAGAIWGVSALAGYPGIIIVNGGVLVLWALGRGLLAQSAHHSEPATNVEQRKSFAQGTGHRTVHALGLSAAALIVGVVILAPSYVAMLVEGKGFTDRSGPLPREVAVGSNALEPGALLTFSSPQLAALKREFPKTLWPRTGISSVSIYAGAVVTWLSLCALFLGARSLWRWWLAILGVVALLLALGDALPLRGWAYDWLAPMRYFRHASIFRGYTLFAAAVLAAFASRDLAELLHLGTRRDLSSRETAMLRHRRLGIAVLGYLVAGTAIICYAWKVTTVGSAQASSAAGMIHTAVAWGGIVLLATLLILPLRPAWTRVIPLALVVLACYDTVATARLSEPLMWTRWSSIAQRWSTLQQHHSSELSLTASGLHREVSGSPDGKATGNYNLLLKQPVLFGYTPFRNRLHQLWRSRCSRGVLPAAATGSNRLWYAPQKQVVEVPVSERQFMEFCQRAAQVDAPPMVIHQRDAMLASASAFEDEVPVVSMRMLPPAQPIAARVLHYTPETLELEVDAPEAGYLVVTDRWARSWEVSVNGVPQKLLGGMFIFRAVEVTPGRNVISFQFRPFAEPYLLLVSWGTLAIVLLFSACGAILSRQRDRGSDHALR